MKAGTEFWDGNSSMPFEYDDGGRADLFKAKAGDCVTRSIAIAAGLPYKEVYDKLADGNANERRSPGKTCATNNRKRNKAQTASHGINTRRKWFKTYMAELGFKWVPLMHIGSGCKCNLVAGALPMGRLVVSLSKHYTAVIDGVIRDNHDPQRQTIVVEPDKPKHIAHRCVYGYWILEQEHVSA